MVLVGVGEATAVVVVGAVDEGILVTGATVTVEAVTPQPVMRIATNNNVMIATVIFIGKPLWLNTFSNFTMSESKF